MIDEPTINSWNLSFERWEIYFQSLTICHMSINANTNGWIDRYTVETITGLNSIFLSLILDRDVDDV